jgi:HEAT repeat protein
MKRSLLLLLVLCGSPTRSEAYIAAIPTLGKVIVDSDHIVVLRVDKVSRDKQVVIFTKVADLKGKDTADVHKHKLSDGFHPRQAHMILDWAEPGNIAVCFVSGKACVTCIGRFWYACAATEAPWWTMTGGKPELAYVYAGSTAKLRDHVQAIVSGREVVVTALKFRVIRPGPGTDHVWEHWDAVEAVGSRRLMRGKDWPLWRLKASLKTPNLIHELMRIPDLLAGDGPAGPGDVPALIKALQLEEANARIDACETLAETGPAAADALTDLRTLAERDADRLVRLAAAKAVAAIDPKDDKAVALLIEALGAKDRKVRRMAAESLGDLGPTAASAVPALGGAAKDADPTVSWAALDALGQIGPAAAAAVPTLVAALDEAGMRAAAIDALGQIGAKARDAAPALDKILKAGNAGTRWAAACALVRIGGPEMKGAVRYLLETATANRERNWTDASNILMAPTARGALPAVLDAVRDPKVRALAVESAVEVSIYLTKDPMNDVRPFLKDKDPAVRCVTAWVLHSARAVPIKEAIGVLRETLSAAHPWAQCQAAHYLGKLGAEARDAVPELSRALDDKDEGVRDAAAKALKAIQRK